jgi:hypothetical protein
MSADPAAVHEQLERTVKIARLREPRRKRTMYVTLRERCPLGDPPVDSAGVVQAVVSAHEIVSGESVELEVVAEPHGRRNVSALMGSR